MTNDPKLQCSIMRHFDLFSNSISVFSLLVWENVKTPSELICVCDFLEPVEAQIL